MDEYITPELTPVQTEKPTAVSVPPADRKPCFTAGKRDFIFAAAVAVLSVLMCNFVMFGGFHVGYALASALLLSCYAVYLRLSGKRFDWYSRSLLILALVITAGFGRSADYEVKQIMFLFATVAVNLSLCLAAGQNRREPGTVLSLLDAPRTLFVQGYGGMPGSARGIVRGFRESGEAGQKTGAILVGLMVCVPILIVMVPLLMDADAAFEGLVKLLPDMNPAEYIFSALFGIFFGWVFYSRCIRLTRAKQPDSSAFSFRGINALTVSTILTAVSLLYLVYLASQLAYFVGGFSGILPEEFTLAEYARRGFFEMAWLCAINLLLICGSVALVRKTDKTPGFLRICCLFIGIVTIFLVATASAKMFLYIGSYGLTRLRVLTEVIMLWLALTTLTVCVWLFLPKTPYMKVVVLTAMVMGAAVFWVDVDTVVAKYNVESYQSGKLETVDMLHLDTLGPAAIPYIHRLVEDPDPEISRQAKQILRRSNYTVEDFRDWNWDKAQAAEILKAFHDGETKAVNALLEEYLQLELPMGTLRNGWNCQLQMENGQQFFAVKFSGEEHEAFMQTVSAAGWKPLPLTAALERAVCGKDSAKSLFTDLDGNIFRPQKGFYTFRNQYPGVEDPTDGTRFFDQDYLCFWLVWYDTGDQILYFFRLDQSVTGQRSDLQVPPLPEGKNT